MYQRKASIVEIIKWLQTYIDGTGSKVVAAAVPQQQMTDIRPAQNPSIPPPVIPQAEPTKVILPDPSVFQAEMEQSLKGLSVENLKEALDNKVILESFYLRKKF